MKVVVCDTGPLTHLWQIDLWSAFSPFHTIHLSGQVAREVEQHVVLKQLEQAHCTINIHTVEHTRIKAKQPIFPDLAIADLSVLILAEDLSPGLVLTDDLPLRRALESQKHKPMGSVGLLLYAYKVGLLSCESLETTIDRLFVHSTLYLSPQFKSYVRNLIDDEIQK